MTEFLDIFDIKWKAIFGSAKKAAKKERTIAFIASYILTGILFFLWMCFFSSEASYYESRGLFSSFLLYWLSLLVVPIIMTAMAVTSVVLFLLFMVPFCIPFLFLWLGIRSKGRTSGIVFCSLSGLLFALLCSMGFYIIGQGG